VIRCCCNECNTIQGVISGFYIFSFFYRSIFILLIIQLLLACGGSKSGGGDNSAANNTGNTERDIELVEVTAAT